MKKWMILLLFSSVLACKKDKPLPPRNFPELKGIWYVQNEYPFWNLNHTQSTTCVDMSDYYFIDSLSPTKYVVYEWDFGAQNYNPSVHVEMQIDTLTDSIRAEHGNTYQNYNPFNNFFELSLKYNRFTKNIEGEIGVNSLVYCTNKPGDSFVGKTSWSKYK